MGVGSAKKKVLKKLSTQNVVSAKSTKGNFFKANLNSLGMVDASAIMGRTAQDINKGFDAKSERNSAKPPLGPDRGANKIIILPNGVVDERENFEENVIQEHEAEYDNFDRNTYFASSFDDHDRFQDINDSQKDKMNSSLGGWYIVGDIDSSRSPAKTKPKKKLGAAKKEDEGRRIAAIKQVHLRLGH